MRWTEDQAAAIDSRGENLLLSAAAGSGKTAVLVERVAKLLLEGADIERMLDAKVFLELWVKVKEGWRNNQYQMRNFGYEDQ